MKDRLVRFRSFWIFPLLAVFLLYFTFREGAQARSLAWLVPLGLLLWSLLEYGLHRFLFHIDPRVPSPKLRAIVDASHPIHHVAPRDPDKLFVRPLYALAVSGLFFGLMWLAIGAAPAAGVLAGIWVGFLYYEWVHYRIHLTNSDSGFIEAQRRAHFYHHFTNKNRCFGVTSPLWDYVFGTTASSERPSP